MIIAPEIEALLAPIPETVISKGARSMFRRGELAAFYGKLQQCPYKDFLNKLFWNQGYRRQEDFERTGR